MDKKALIVLVPYYRGSSNTFSDRPWMILVAVLVPYYRGSSNTPIFLLKDLRQRLSSRPLLPGII